MVFCTHEKTEITNYYLSHFQPDRFGKKQETVLQGLCNSAMTILLGNL